MARAMGRDRSQSQAMARKRRIVCILLHLTGIKG